MLASVAEYLLSIRFAQSDIDQMQYLADRSENGELTDDEARRVRQLSARR